MKALDRGAKQAPLNGKRLGQKFLAGQRAASGSRGPEAAEEGVEVASPEFVLGLGERGQGGEVGRQRGVKGSGQLGQETMAQKIAARPQLGVGCILTPWLVACLEPGAQLGAAKSQQRPHNAVRPAGENAGQTGRASAAQQPQQDGFSLIVGSVGGGHEIGCAGSDQPGEEGVTLAPPHLLAIALRRLRFGFAKVKLDLVFRSEGADEAGISGRFPTPVVIEVGDGELQAMGRSKLRQQQKQRHGVGATGDGGSDAVARSKEAGESVASSCHSGILDRE